MENQKYVVAHNAIIATATSVAISTLGAKKCTIEFTEAGTVNNRSGVLTITGAVTRGGTHRAINMLIDNVANSNVQNLTRVASKTRAAAGTDLLFLDLANYGFAEIKVVVTITDGASPTGNFTVNVLVEK
jgi:hypothetical protein